MSQQLDISLCIPCDIAHFKYIFDSLKITLSCYAVPREINVCISNVQDPESVWSVIEKSGLPGFINWYVVGDRRNASQNRNFLASKSKCRIISFQDADDLPHVLRIPVLNEIFARFPIVHCNHSFEYVRTREVPDGVFQDISQSIRVSELKKYHPQIFEGGFLNFDRSRSYGNFRSRNSAILDCEVANGTTTVLSEIFDHIKYEENPTKFRIAEDQDFNYMVYYQYNQSAVVHNPLYYYNISDRLGGGF